jgi:hypothetical protein
MLRTFYRVITELKPYFIASMFRYRDFHGKLSPLTFEKDQYGTHFLLTRINFY